MPSLATSPHRGLNQLFLFPVTLIIRRGCACRRQSDQGATDGDQELSLASVDGLLLAAGGSDEDNPYKKTTAFQVGSSCAIKASPVQPLNKPMRATGFIDMAARLRIPFHLDVDLKAQDHIPCWCFTKFVSIQRETFRPSSADRTGNLTGTRFFQQPRS